MGVVVQFDYQAWLALFPEFSYISLAQATAYFNVATTLNRNDGGGPVSLAATQSTLLNYVVAHLCFLYSPPGGDGPKPVGRISSATEGSVSVSLDLPGKASESRDFWVQSTYGQLYWAMTAPYRTFRVVPYCGGPPWPPRIWPPAGWPIR